jgi:hypothetical protein
MGTEEKEANKESNNEQQNPWKPSKSGGRDESGRREKHKKKDRMRKEILFSL